MNDNVINKSNNDMIKNEMEDNSYYEICNKSDKSNKH